MKKISISKIQSIIKSDSILAIGGFTINRKPISIINEIAKSNIKNLHLFLLAGSLDVDILVQSGKVKKISAAYIGYEGLGNSKITRNAVESKSLEFEDLSEIIYYFRLKAGAFGKDFFTTNSLIHSDILKINSACKKTLDAACKKEVCSIKSLNPDFCIIHAQKVDMQGNILIDEPDFSEKEMARASKKTIFSVEEIVDKLKPNKITIPGKFVDYVIVKRESAQPTGCKNYYKPNIKKIRGFMENGKF